MAARLGIDKNGAMDAINDDAIKVKLVEASETAIERKVCGSSFFFVDGEPFWGSDRLDMVDHWLETGGW